jgi:hypothetical protein
MISISPTTVERTRQILEDLEAVRENLRALSDDIWLSIDHNDPQALEAGVEFKRAYNAKAIAFDQLASELSALVQQYTSVRLEAVERTGADDREQNERIIAELNREEPHPLTEDFTYRRPHGFILDGQATNGITTWQRMYQLVCEHFIARDEGRFRSLSDHPDFVSNRGHHTVTRDPGSLRQALAVGEQLYVERNLSANSIRDVMVRILAAFDIPVERMQVFLRQDRDAGRPRDDG